MMVTGIQRGGLEKTSRILMLRRNSLPKSTLLVFVVTGASYGRGDAYSAVDFLV